MFMWNERCYPTQAGLILVGSRHAIGWMDKYLPEMFHCTIADLWGKTPDQISPLRQTLHGNRRSRREALRMILRALARGYNVFAWDHMCPTTGAVFSTRITLYVTAAFGHQYIYALVEGGSFPEMNDAQLAQHLDMVKGLAEKATNLMVGRSALRSITKHVLACVTRWGRGLESLLIPQNA